MKIKHLKIKGYSIDEYGNVFSFKKNRYLKPYNDKDGYLIITMSDNNIPKRYKLHRLVAEYFIKGFNKKKQINHKDFNKKNNHFSNLEMSNHRHNQNHKWNKNNTKKYGIFKHNNKWRSVLSIKNKKILEIGVFKTKDEAYNAFYNAYYNYHGIPPWNLKDQL